MQGFDLCLEPQLTLLEGFEGSTFQELFAALGRDPLVNPDKRAAREAEVAVRNAYYPSPDAEIYAALILRHRPRRIIEVGSGYSTAIARRALTESGVEAELHVIDPAPRRAVEDLADRVEYRPVQESSLAERGVPEGSLLFIDSSHVTRSGGDGPFLYGALLPSLPPDVLVQVHDVFLPYDYPRVYVEWLYTEQYLLQVLLATGDKFEPLLATYALSRRHPEAMRRAFGAGVARDGAFEGASFWMRSVS